MILIKINLFLTPLKEGVFVMHNFLSKREVPKNDVFLFQFFGTIGLFQCYLNDIGRQIPLFFLSYFTHSGWV